MWSHGNPLFRARSGVQYYKGRYRHMFKNLLQPWLHHGVEHDGEAWLKIINSYYTICKMIRYHFWGWFLFFTTVLSLVFRNPAFKNNNNHHLGLVLQKTPNVKSWDKLPSSTGELNPGFCRSPPIGVLLPEVWKLVMTIIPRWACALPGVFESRNLRNKNPWILVVLCFMVIFFFKRILP